ncbi:hypothetical protein EDD21DRAFT_410014 [Dissophora ornata]|nr:hypothetical protein EDD21DRAFT_410014 [Dissophora ornata]
MDEPYFIERDLVTPPLSLQPLIFPWIESSFNKDMPWKTDSWIKECDQEMEGVDPDGPTESNLHWVPVEESTSTAKLTELVSSTLVDRISFLKLLVRMRRVILQDAVLYMKPDELGRTLSNALITSLPHIFQIQEFHDFQVELLQAINTHHGNPNLINPHIQVHGETMINAVNSFYSQTVQQFEILRQSFHSLANQRSQEEQLRSQQEQLIQHQERERHELRVLLQQMQQQMQQQIQQIYMRIEQSNLVPLRQQHLRQHHHQPQLPYLQPQPSYFQLQPTYHEPQPQPQPQLEKTQPQQRQQQQQQQQEDDDKAKGYVMLPDSGLLTVRQAWDEFHGPISHAKEDDRAWPFTTARKRAYTRRRQFIDLIMMEAAERGQSIDDFLDAFTTEKKSSTMNSIRVQLEAKAKAKAQAASAGQMISESEEFEAADEH